MSIVEIAYRLGRAVRVRLERIGLSTARNPPAPDATDRPSARFIHIPAIDGTRYAAAANRIIAGEFAVFALPRAATGHDINWNRDPLTGTVASLTFGKTIDYRDEGIVGNIKYLWEPNRHLELVTLAQAYALTGEERYQFEVRRRLESWLDQCPYPLGPNWSSSLELGIRLISWSLVWQLIGAQDSELFKGAIGNSFRRRWLDSIYQHVYFICHHYSRYSSANNHLIGEAAGVFVAASTWPYWKDFEKWRRRAWRTLLVEAGRQTHCDGVSREQAVAYQQFVLDFLLLSGLAARATAIEIPADYWKTIERMMEFLLAIMDVGGNVPMFGDADDGFVVRLSQQADFCPFRSLLATGAVLFGRQDFALGSGGLDDKTRFLLRDQTDAFPSLLECKHPSLARRQFPDGGYYVLGQHFGTNQEIRAIVDAGPLGYLSIAAHGHADALSIVLSVAGREILVDPGTYSYHTKPKWRQYFRGTRAHNTVCVDFEDQSVQGGNFMWLRHAQARCIDFGHDATSGHFSGEHDGYARLSSPVIHRRDVVHDRNMIEVSDRLVCDGYHFVERCWHFSDECDVSVDGSTIVAANGPVRVVVRPAAPVTSVRKYRGSDDPPAGWMSRRFDVKVPTSSVVFVDEIEGTTELKTIINCEIQRQN